jgi:hypothetical protein
LINAVVALIARFARRSVVNRVVISNQALFPSVEQMIQHLAERPPGDAKKLRELLVLKPRMCPSAMFRGGRTDCVAQIDPQT